MQNLQMDHTSNININTFNSFIILKAICNVSVTQVYCLLWLNLLTSMYVFGKHLDRTQERKYLLSH
jgi:hypothetical protein